MLFSDAAGKANGPHHSNKALAYQPRGLPPWRRVVKRWRHRDLSIGLICGFLFAIAYFQWFPSRSPNRPLSRLPSRPAGGLACSRLPGADDILVVMKTGATEFQDKLPVHLSTTLRCYPNYMIVADFGENFRGENVIDVLESLDEGIRKTHPDFELYRRLEQRGRAALNSFELSGPNSRVAGNIGHTDNPGWKLDKWKFLPMMNRTLHEYPDMKWYLFTETDTYIFWTTLLEYLAALDHTQPYYLGGQINIGPITFAQGGAGFAVSNEALRRVTRHYADHQEEWDDFTDDHWAGDCVLGKAFRDADAELTHAWPIFQSDDIGVVPYARDDGGKRLWCYPTVSYHHLSRDTIDDMWTFEQEWIAGKDKHSEKFIRHKDVFLNYILPRVREPKKDWDNECEDDQGRFASVEACADMCKRLADCLQYTYNVENKICKTSTVPRLGQAREGRQSGWMLKRVEQWAAGMAPCGNEKWLY